MAVFEFKLPDIGEGIHEGEIVKWFVKAGDTVKEDDILLEVQNDKAVVEIPAPVDGTVKEVKVSEGTVAVVGDVLITFDIEGDAPAGEEEAAPDRGRRMSNKKRGSGRRQSGGRKPPKVDPVDFWKPVPLLPDPEPISVTTDPTMVVRSLGAPPLPGQGLRAEHEIHRVLVRSSMLAGALADVAGLLAEDDDAEG